MSELPANIAYFARALRAAGLPVGPAHVVDAVAAVEAAGLGSREDLYWTLHAVFVRKHEHTLIYDQAFKLFWRKRAYMEKLMAMLMPVATDRANRAPDAASRRVKDAMFKNVENTATPPKPRVDIDAMFTVSDAETLRAKDFEQMTAEEVTQAKREIARLRLVDEDVETRRLAPNPRGRLIDPRATFRRSLRAGGMIALARRDRRVKTPPIVALCDISGSMSQYTRVFLHFLHALTGERRRVHTFLFGTRLSNVTRQLKAKDPDEALAACSKAVPDWSGGTRIASSLHAFNRDWSRRVLAQGAIVLLVTDGLERDDTGLEAEIARLSRSCRRLVWLNPLLRYDGFQPKARGIRVILPHVDEFRSVHNLRSIADLVAALGAAAAREADPKRWLKRAA